jgi:hypothetical protein
MNESVNVKKEFRRNKCLEVGSEAWKKYVEEKYNYKYKEGNYVIKRQSINRKLTKCNAIVRPSKYEKAYEIYLSTGYDDQFKELMLRRKEKEKETRQKYLSNNIRSKRKRSVESMKIYLSNPYKRQRIKSVAYLNIYKELHPLIFDKSWVLDRLTFEKNNELGKNEFLYTEFIDDLTILNMHKKLKEYKNKDVKDIVKMHIMCKEEIEEQEHEDEE